MTDNETNTNDDRTLEDRIEDEMVEDNPLERLLVDADEANTGTIAIDDVTIDAEEFLKRLDALADAAETVAQLAEDVAAIRRSGLYDDDVVSLMYGRKHGMAKRDIEAILDALDDIESADATPREELLVILVRELSHTTKDETREVFDELRRLRSRYAGVEDNDG